MLRPESEWYANAPGKRLCKPSVDHDTSMHLDDSYSEAERDARAFALEAVRQNGLLLEHVGPDMLTDREVVLAAVRENGLALVFADEALRNDRLIVETAVSNDGRALRCASEDLKMDREVVLAALRNHGALIWAHDELRSPREDVTPPDL